MGAATNCTGVDDVPGQAEVDSYHLVDDRLFACMILYRPFWQGLVLEDARSFAYLRFAPMER